MSESMKTQKWVCTHCGAEGSVEYEEHAGVYEVVTLLRDDHIAKAPTCPTHTCIAIIHESETDTPTKA